MRRSVRLFFLLSSVDQWRSFLVSERGGEEDAEGTAPSYP